MTHSQNREDTLSGCNSDHHCQEREETMPGYKFKLLWSGERRNFFRIYSTKSFQINMGGKENIFGYGVYI